MFKASPRTDCPATEWNAAADSFPKAWAWHRTELLDARSAWRQTNDASFYISEVSNKGRIVALVPLVIVMPRMLSGCIGGHLESTGGPAIHPDLPQKSMRKVQECILTELDAIAMKHKIRRADFSVAPLSPEIRAIDRPVPNPLCNFDVKDRSTQSWMLPLQPAAGEDGLWQGLEHRARKQVKKAERNGLSVEMISPTAALLDQYYDLHLKTCVRNSLPPHPRDYFQAIFEDVSKSLLCKTCVVSAGKRVISIQNFLVFKNCALYWTVASDDDALQLCGNDYGIWQAIRHFHAAGLDFLECGEAFPGAMQGKQKGLNDFKKSFGGELYPYYRGSIEYRPVLEGILGIMRSLRKSGAAT
ncbi:lipid II:glycine glycyltransferase FemX [Thalassospira povalilytica]|uniref:lipid II:glycine glycyltransferase FemX n=1 Tax=Thalassospira povalilytica TaxID=732237 RepID=UPI003AA90037